MNETKLVLLILVFGVGCFFAGQAFGLKEKCTEMAPVVTGAAYCGPVDCRNGEFVRLGLCPRDGGP